MAKRLDVYKCTLCGNIVEVLTGGDGELVCCGQPMKHLAESTADAANEKHVPVIEQIDGGYKVKVGSVLHPMEEKHYIEWIELIADGRAYREFLSPGNPAEAVFMIDAEDVSARSIVIFTDYGKVKVMIDKKLEMALNEQINAEFYSAYLYLSMSAYFDTINFAGFANWMLVQFQEEQFHAKKMFDYLIERGGKVTLTEIAAPPVKWDGPVSVFQATLEHEQMVTKRINDLVYLARDERDNAVEVFLQWFVSEQVEEEDTAETLLGQLKIAESSPHALLMLDRELAARVFMLPAK